MLTEISWWGGLIYVWGYLAFRMTADVAGEDGGNSPARVPTYLLSAILLCAYFYPQSTPWGRAAFIAECALAALSLVAFAVPELTAPRREEDADVTPTWLAIGHVVNLGAPTIAIALGIYRSFEHAKALGWLP